MEEMVGFLWLCNVMTRNLHDWFLFVTRHVREWLDEVLSNDTSTLDLCNDETTPCHCNLCNFHVGPSEAVYIRAWSGTDRQRYQRASPTFSSPLFILHLVSDGVICVISNTQLTKSFFPLYVSWIFWILNYLSNVFIPIYHFS